MKTSKIFGLLAALIITATAVTSCAGAPALATADFSQVEGIEWSLVELRRGTEIIRIDREAFAALDIGEAYSLTFEDGRVSGMGAINRFFGPFTLGEGSDLSIGHMASTMMAALFEVECLREHEYFAYLSNVTSWSVNEQNLYLRTSSEDGNEAILVFASM